ncbi:cell envelope integrity protein CreD [Roseomonas hellenica]|uniref:Cell envelope integrity protein CreD n=1 Tax=Plastoroseomonas hellenica TaxID=2687306 RepID=A0ABS5F155_9PROT|nr:cell envelope integrity protein CreD [Plastoroseomonas hellenica]MBR0665865.1 cell envelope integrity protein CreD [Plastoroseomonas hellenica]
MSATEPPSGVIPPMPAPPTRPRSLAASLGIPTIKLGMLAGLLLALLLPQYFIADLIAEREGRQEEVRREIGASWGQPQTVLGPLLVLPYRVPSSRAPSGWDRAAIAIPPAELSTQAAVMPERRRRGLFETVVYTARIDLAARFAIEAVLPDGAEALWGDAYLLTGSSDQRPVAAAPNLRWGGRVLTPAEGGQERCGGLETLRWPLRLEGPPEPGQAIAVSGEMELRGTSSLGFLPFAARARFTAAGAWDSPSYIGGNLPSRTTLDDAGFRAEWSGGVARRAFPTAAAGGCGPSIAEVPSMGVALLEAVPTYRMVNRAAKYALMFLVLAFLTYLLFELVAGLRIHLVQYGLLGFSVVLFPLLLLAIAEPAGFAAAYAISTAMVMAQASLYTASVTHDRRLALIFAGVLATLFGFLYVVLSLESLALLTGAVALFAALSVVMLVTRRIRWGA